MGKKDNIRRAKKLKVAKRNRELEMQIQNNMIGNIDTLINRNSKDQPMLINNSPIKYSAIILDYLSPFLDIKDSESTCGIWLLSNNWIWLMKKKTIHLKNY